MEIGDTKEGRGKKGRGEENRQRERDANEGLDKYGVSVATDGEHQRKNEEPTSDE